VVGVFGIGEFDGMLYLAKAMVVTEGDVMTLPIVATDNAGATSVKNVFVEILPPSNKRPTIHDAERVVQENWINKPVGVPLTCVDDAVDVARGQRLTYTIEDGNDLGNFVINSWTGQLRTTPDAVLDFEKGPTQYTLTIQCQDDGMGELADTATVSISIIDMNEVPVMEADEAGEAIIFENVPSNYLVNGEFTKGQGVGGMKRCLSKWGCLHFLGEGNDKYFNHEDMSGCASCQIVKETTNTPTNHSTYSGYVLKMDGTQGANQVYKAYTGVEMAVSHPSDILIRAWVKVSKDYTANQNIFRATTYKSAPPTKDWKLDTYGSADGSGDGAFPSTGGGKEEDERGEWVLIESSVTLKNHWTMHKTNPMPTTMPVTIQEKMKRYVW